VCQPIKNAVLQFSTVLLPLLFGIVIVNAVAVYALQHEPCARFDNGHGDGGLTDTVQEERAPYARLTLQQLQRWV
jgi:hypothetical protein